MKSYYNAMKRREQEMQSKICMLEEELAKTKAALEETSHEQKDVKRKLSLEKAAHAADAVAHAVGHLLSCCSFYSPHHSLTCSKKWWRTYLLYWFIIFWCFFICELSSTKRAFAGFATPLGMVKNIQSYKIHTGSRLSDEKESIFKKIWKWLQENF